MSKERARRREAREREAAIVAASRAAEAERRERRAARSRALTGWLPRRTPRPTGILAERRRKQLGATVAVLVVLNVLAWTLADPAVAALLTVATPLAAPVLHTLLFRRA
ncbi:MAG: hypothetical protein F2667_01105 [Actinobacteria bacterium]|uniref:Unannotated protein n=1 Tax=freshwater metagenome TaxID=449393 RepID=A0A6J6NMH4_9ZZZZ|nr:hypothetical protein [Actinomycetota bacterium]